ncbi:MAG: LPP20 family lipoprotein [bacterium]
MAVHFKSMLISTISFLIFSLSFFPLNAQSIDQIKASTDQYIWGEGTGITLKAADNEALQMLISQISVQVESKFQHFVKEEEQKGSTNNYQFEDKVKSVVNTYSNATLHNTERIVINNEPNAKVFRYIKRKNVDKVFENRKDKIFDFVDNARKAVKERRIGDGLRYYYWAFTLLKSLPDCDDIRYTDEMGKDYPLISWIPIKMNEVFSHIDFQVDKKESHENMKTVFLSITYKDEPVDNLDYSYWDGRDWSNLISIKDGRGFIEFYGAAAKGTEKARVKAEYIYENQTNIENELKTVMSKIDPIPFRQSYYTVDFDKTAEKSNTKERKVETNITRLENPIEYEISLKKVQEAIKQKKYDSVYGLFTERGYEMFQKLIEYGNAQILPNEGHKFYKFRTGVMARSIPMSFSFKNNNEQFIEDVVFHFNKDKKIGSLSFGLSKDALKSIIEKDVWNEVDRMVLINFLEHYKTAYALKRLDYIESIFADDALIITGYVVKLKPNADSRYQSNRIVRYNRQSKTEYIRNLRYSFNSKEYINIQFEESRVRKGGNGGNIYGVQIKQNYYSSNYGDQGYLFLMVDLNEPKEPIIHVRTWQPTAGKQDSIYGLSDF